MKISVRNLGPIREAEFDLKPLTIFIGPNNAGKTWLAYMIAGLFSDYGLSKYLHRENFEDSLKRFKPLTEAVKKLVKTGTAQINIQQFASDYSVILFQELATTIKEWLPEFLGTRVVSFSDLEISLSLNHLKEHIIKQVTAYPLQFAIGVGKEETHIHARKKANQKNLYIFTTVNNQDENENQDEDILPAEIISHIIATEIFTLIHNALFYQTRIFPTERTTYATYQYNAIPLLTKVSKEEETAIKQALQKNLRSLSVPVGEYINLMIDSYRLEKNDEDKREKQANKNPSIRKLKELADLLEQKILGGQIKFNDPDPAPARDIYYYANNNAPLEIAVTSSMVKELSPLVLYLRYFAQPGELLVIDEPEMNLHPRAQVQILEFLGMLVNAGLHVIVTTHSPYIIDHLDNLFKARDHQDVTQISSEFFLHDQRAFIGKDQTAVYLVDQGKIIDALDDDLDWDTFGMISDRLSEIYFKL